MVVGRRGQRLATVSGDNVYQTAGGNALHQAPQIRARLLTSTGKCDDGIELTGDGANNGYVMIGNNAGVGSWMPFDTLGVSSNTITTNANNVYLPHSASREFGPILRSAGAALSVMRRECRHRDMVPGYQLNVQGGDIDTGSFVRVGEDCNGMRLSLVQL